MIQKDYYKILGVSRDSDIKELKQAYRRLVRKNHPDYNPLDPHCEERLREINESYEVLINPTTRQRVDRWLSAIDQTHQPKTSMAYFAEEENAFSYKKAIVEEWNRAWYWSKLFALFCLPTAFYLFLVQWESIQSALNVFVILFVGTFYIALFFCAKAVFHGATTLVMKTPEKWRPRAQVLIPFLLFVLPLHYFTGNENTIQSAMASFINHSWHWFFFATIIISLTSLFGFYFESPLASRFPFRLSVLAVFLTFTITFFKAIPLPDKSKVLFDYIFLNLTMQTGLILAHRLNRRRRHSF